MEVERPLFHRVKIREPKHGKAQGCQIELDGVKIKGLINYEYKCSFGEMKRLTVEILVQNIEIEVIE